MPQFIQSIKDVSLNTTSTVNNVSISDLECKQSYLLYTSETLYLEKNNDFLKIIINPNITNVTQDVFTFQCYNNNASTCNSTIAFIIYLCVYVFLKN